MPLVAFRDDFGVRASISDGFLVIFGVEGRSGTLPDPTWHPRPKKSEQRAKKGPQMETFLGPLPSFWPLGGSFGDPGGQKEHPEGLRGRFCGHRKNIDFLLVFIGFWSFGPLGGGPKASPERHFEPTGALREHFGPIFLYFCQRLNFEVDFGSPVPR